MKTFCQAVALIDLAIEEVGAQVVSILAVAIEEVDGLYLLDHSDGSSLLAHSRSLQ